MNKSVLEEENWDQFGERKRRQLRNLQQLYVELGKPSKFSDIEQIGRTCSTGELVRLTKQAREELATKSKKVPLLYDVEKRVCNQDGLGATLECDLHPIGDKAPYNYHFVQKGETYYELTRNGILAVLAADCYIAVTKEAAV